MEKEYDEIVDEEDDIIEFEIIDGKMYLSLENVNKSIDQATKNYKEVIDRIFNETKETRNILNNNRDNNMLSKSCLLSYLEIVEDILKDVSK